MRALVLTLIVLLVSIVPLSSTQAVEATSNDRAQCEALVSWAESVDWMSLWSEHESVVVNTLQDHLPMTWAALTNVDVPDVDVRHSDMVEACLALADVLDDYKLTVTVTNRAGEVVAEFTVAEAEALLMESDLTAEEVDAFLADLLK